MKIALIADTFPPLRTSGAVQLRDLAREFARQGHEITVMLPNSDQSTPWQLENVGSVQVLRLKAPKTKDVGYVRRTLAEFLMPFAMRCNYRKSPLAKQRWGGVVWYSPSIFHGPFVNSLKTISVCKSYLIVRDIFPEWAVDMGLMGRGLPYRFFSAVANYQYSVADVIGIQTPGNSIYFKHWLKKPKRSLEVLQNWLDKPAAKPCSIDISKTNLAGRKIFVYAGNMGIAQGMDIVLSLAESIQSQKDIGFVFVGRGSEAARLRQRAQQNKSSNILFFDEIDPDEIPQLYAQCAVGVVALDPKHKTHNIPGKFLTYMQCGLPVLANVNTGNDLVELIKTAQVGEACDTNNLQDLQDATDRLIKKILTDNIISERCRTLFNTYFSVSSTVNQITNHLYSKFKQ